MTAGGAIVWCVQFVARPRKDVDLSDGADGMKGAFANCWVRHDDRAEAVRLAQQELDSAGWDVEEMQFVDEVRTRDLSEEARQYYEQALEEGVCAVFWGWTEEDGADA